MFKFYLFLGKCGFFRYEGMRGRHPRWWPTARVKYKDGKISEQMPVGTALDYADIFSGEVVK
jgi:hypothetical protein